jgi:hypothetical protein
MKKAGLIIIFLILPTVCFAYTHSNTQSSSVVGELCPGGSDGVYDYGPYVGVTWNSFKGSSQPDQYFSSGPGDCASGTGYGYTECFARAPGGSYYDCFSHCMPKTDACPNYTANVPEVPEHCSNYVADAGESGIDCGGECPSPCNYTRCDPGYMNIIETCYPVYTPREPDMYGNMPPGYTEYGCKDGDVRDGDVDLCVGTATVPATPTAYDDGVFDPPVADSSTDPGDDWTPGVSVVDYEAPTPVAEIPATAPAGTASATQEKTTTATSGGGTTTATKTTYYGADGQILGSSTVTDVPPGENPDNYDLTGLKLPGDSEYNTDIEIPEKKALIPSESDWIDNIPLVAAIRDLQIQTAYEAGVCEITIPNVFGQTLIISFCRWESLLRAFGAILVIVVQGYSIFIVLKGPKVMGGGSE